MNITVIIDKSTFQSLSYHELAILSRYYKHNITPILVMEILGDLKKETQEGKPPSEKRVIDFANKLFPHYTIVNAHYSSLVREELLGGEIGLDGRPQVKAAKAVKSGEGAKGLVIEPSEEEESIFKWKAGRFSEADRELSQLWRNSTTKKDLLQNLKSQLLSSQKVKVGFKSFEELNQFVESNLNDRRLHEHFLLTAIQNYVENPSDGVLIMRWWNMSGRPSIREFAPYTYHCLKVDSLFTFGLVSDLISVRPTNRVDTEYLYYLPFCNVFTSSDKLHSSLVPFLINPRQKFYNGNLMKEDFKSINNYLDSISFDNRKGFKDRPPIIENSLTFKLWKEFFDYPRRNNWKQDDSPEELEYVRKKMQEFEEASKGTAIDMEPGEQPDFVIRKTWLSASDPCFCGSGRRVIDCCIPPEEFMRLAKTHGKSI